MNRQESKYRIRKKKRIKTGLILFLISLCFLHGKIKIISGQGDSMAPTFTGGKYIVNCMYDSYKIGDIVRITENPIRSDKHGYIGKRIVAGPNDVIFVSSADDAVYVNGELSPYSLHNNGPINEYDILPYIDKEIVLGEDEYYVMGDNRIASSDSRQFGPIKECYIDGVFVYEIKGFDW